MTITEIYRNILSYHRKVYPYKNWNVHGFKSGVCMFCEKDVATHIVSLDYFMWCGEPNDSIRHIDACEPCGKKVQEEDRHVLGLCKKDYTGENNIYE